ncbi:hypothetical protein [Shimia sp.]|uniref:hypothetical protein n=1 Tax=Shimia sp. TaxID=1954381 RepID=UPI0035619EF2
MFRIALLLSAFVALISCSVPTTMAVDDPELDLGAFRLGHNIVVTPKVVKGPLSRDASDGDWVAALKAALDARLGRYEGTRLVHLGVAVEGYVLAQPGIPIIAAPKSALILSVTAWDDRAGVKFNADPKSIVVLESFSGGSLIGSGYTMSAEEQMANLTHNAARSIEAWLHENRACMSAEPETEVQADCWKKTNTKIPDLSP